MVHRVEGGGQVKETEKCNVTTIGGSHEVGYDFENSGLGRVSMPIGRLQTWEETVLIEISNQLVTDQRLHDLRPIGQVRDGSVVFTSAGSAPDFLRCGMTIA
jgi:hypothetical protein